MTFAHNGKADQEKFINSEDGIFVIGTDGLDPKPIQCFEKQMKPNILRRSYKYFEKYVIIMFTANKKLSMLRPCNST
jgi:hypothetical protein